MRCLIVGGTGFLGGALTDTIAHAGHEVSVLARGQSVRPLPEGVDIIRADRYEDMSPLKERHFDWVFDTCAYTPKAVNMLLDALENSFERYVLISSISAYGDFTEPYLTEDQPVPEPNDNDFAVALTIAASERTSAFAYGASYGPLKRGCEIVAEKRLGQRVTALRVGLLVGVHDYTDRLTWWVRRIDEANGKRRSVPAPRPPTRSVQLIDVRDVAHFALQCAEKKLASIWNVTGSPMPLIDLLNAIVRVAKSSADILWIDEQKIVEAGIEPWVDFPLMTPIAPQFQYLFDVDTRRAQTAGLQCRSIDDILIPVLASDREHRELPLKCGLTLEQEALLLA